MTGGCYTIAESWNGNGWSSGVFYKLGGYWSGLTPNRPDGSDAGAFDFDSDRQMGSYGPRSYNELRPKTKFYNLLIYAGYPTIL